MTTTISYCILICSTAIVVVFSAFAPSLLSDQNEFLEGFVNHEFLNILGVIVTITLASSANLHLTLNQIEERHQTKNAFLETRGGVRSAAYALIVLFVVALLLVVAKPLLATAEWSETIFNGSALLVIVWNVLILIALMEAVFGLRPDIKD